MQRKYSGINGSMIEVSKTFVRRGCTDQRAYVDRTSMHIGDGGSFELVDMFCYLGDMLSVDGDADAAVEARVRKGWNKFKQHVSAMSSGTPIAMLERRGHRHCSDFHN